MDHFEKIAAHLADDDLDALLLTGEANRYYASGFHSAGTDGVALVTRQGNYYFTDARYTEAAGRQIRNAALGEVGHGKGYGTLIQEVIDREGIRRVGFEDGYMTVLDHSRYQKALSCELVARHRAFMEAPGGEGPGGAGGHDRCPADCGAGPGGHPQ